MKELLKSPKSYIALVVLYFCLGVTELITLNKDQRLDVLATCMLVVSILLYMRISWGVKGLKILSVFYALVNLPFLILGLMGSAKNSGQVALFGFDFTIHYGLYFIAMSAFIALQIYVAFWVTKALDRPKGEIDTEI